MKSTKNNGIINLEYCKHISDKVFEAEKTTDNFKPKRENRMVFRAGRKDKDPFDFWKNIPEEIWDHLVQNSYPYGDPISDAWFSVIRGTPDNPGFHGLHQDHHWSNRTNDLRHTNETHVTSFVIYKSDDFSGGLFIIGGDDWWENKDLILADPYNPNNLSHRLQVFDSPVGTSFTWRDFIIHGVSEVTSGTRISLMVTKESEFTNASSGK